MKKIIKKNPKMTFAELIYGYENDRRTLFVPIEAIDDIKIDAIVSSKRMDKDKNDWVMFKRCNNFSICINRDGIDNDLEYKLDNYLDISGINIHYTYGSIEHYDIKFENYTGSFDGETFDFNLLQQISYKTCEHQQMIISVKELVEYGNT